MSLPEAQNDAMETCEMPVKGLQKQSFTITSPLFPSLTGLAVGVSSSCAVDDGIISKLTLTHSCIGQSLGKSSLVKCEWAMTRR